MRLHEINESKGSYAAVKFDADTIKALAEYQAHNNIPAPLDKDEFHATVMFSTKYCPAFEALGEGLDWSGEFTDFDIFPSDEDNALVLKFSCPELEQRFADIMQTHDASWDYDDYLPHVTLSYNVQDLDHTALPAYTGPIIIVSEYGTDLELDWAADHK